MQPGPADRDVDLAGLLAVAGVQVLLVEVEQAEEIDEVRLHEAQAAQVGELGSRSAACRSAAPRGSLPDAAAGPRPRCGTEAVLDLRAREVMQHHLHHGELVQVGVQQRLDDHAAGIVTSARCAAVIPCMQPESWRCSSGSGPCPHSRPLQHRARRRRAHRRTRRRAARAGAARKRAQRACRLARQAALPPRFALSHSGERLLRMEAQRLVKPTLLRPSQQPASLHFRWTVGRRTASLSSRRKPTAT